MFLEACVKTEIGKINNWEFWAESVWSFANATSLCKKASKFNLESLCATVNKASGAQSTYSSNCKGCRFRRCLISLKHFPNIRNSKNERGDHVYINLIKFQRVICGVVKERALGGADKVKPEENIGDNMAKALAKVKTVTAVETVSKCKQVVSLCSMKSEQNYQDCRKKLQNLRLREENVYSIEELCSTIHSQHEYHFSFKNNTSNTKSPISIMYRVTY